MQWRMSNAKDKDARDAAGWAYSERMGSGLLPTDAAEWQVELSNSRWEQQQLQVRLTLQIFGCQVDRFCHCYGDLCLFYKWAP